MTSFRFKFQILFAAVILHTDVSIEQPPCDSKIWCDGPLLKEIQQAKIFNDSKTFVDMNLKDDPERVLASFTSLLHSSNTLTRKQIQDFVDTNFDGPNNEFETWTPSDYTENPPFLNDVKDPNLRAFGKELCRIWSDLGRKIKKDVEKVQNRYSLIYLEDPFIVPGGRFRETYYWDSYWVVEGLLVCNMTETVKGMLRNFVSLVKRFGFVPNGNRVYYLRRSQPPFLIPMVDLYLNATHDLKFLEEIISTLAAEYNFWNINRTVTVKHNSSNKTFPVNRYAVEVTKPRPESYSEDVNIAAARPSTTSAEEMYSNLASAAESGWDFSSRWFSFNYTETTNISKWLTFIDTKNVIPVDLNGILCWNADLMSKFYRMLNQTQHYQEFEGKHKERIKVMDAVFWDNTSGSWFDYSISDSSRRHQFYPSNIFPLFAMCYDKTDDTRDKRLFQYLQRSNVLKYQSGVPTSVVQTGQQWDMPNAWPPLQDILITALYHSSSDQAKKYAVELASKWVSSNYLGWKKSGHMFEKYVVDAVGSRGSGGEYNVQEGFGWTNGVILSLLVRFGQELSVDDAITNDFQNPMLCLSLFVSTLLTLYLLKIL